MSLRTLLINGPSGGGKSTVARLILQEVLNQPVHLVRLRPARDGHTNAVEQAECLEDDPGWASRHCVTYTAERVFETLPEAVRAARQCNPNGLAIIEADGDPAIRHAYPYDYRLFVMPPPAQIHEVFRVPKDAAVALQEVMQDTAAFASEIFGLFDAKALDDSVGVRHSKVTIPGLRPGMPRRFERLDIAETQLRHFLGSPIGAEIAARIQLQPEYHALVEADMVLINTGLGGCKEATRECIHRAEKLLSRIRHDARRHSVLYWGDLASPDDPARGKLIRRLRNLLDN